MFTDIAGYTAMMQENEADAMMKRDRQRKVLTESVSSYNGKIIQTFGDGNLCIFPSSLDAVSCAVKIQLELQRGTIVPLRIGIHIGDISYDNKDIYGDSVNVASRIESLAVGGAVLISEKVYDDIKNQPSLPTVSLGKFEFKNVFNPIEVYAVSVNGLKIPQSNEMKGKLKNAIETIAVLPFANMSADPDNEYFSDGISEEILNALTKVRGLQVVARTSSFSFKGKNEDIREIGKKLNASSLIEGSVRKSGNKVRITVQLINVSDGTHYWSEVYDRELIDIFQVQDEISLAIAHKFEQKSDNIHSPKTLVKTSTVNLEAYDLYLKTVYKLNYSPSEESNLEAISNYEKIISLDPAFAKAYAMMAASYATLGIWGGILPHTAFPKVKEYAEKAIALDDTLCEAYLAYADYKKNYEWDWNAVEELILKAISLNPNSADARIDYALFLRNMGKNKEAITQAEEAVSLDPLSINLLNGLGIICLGLEEYDKAFSAFQRALSINPKSRHTLFTLGFYYLAKGEYDKAMEEIDYWNKTQDNWVKGTLLFAAAMAKEGNNEPAYEMIANLKSKSEKDNTRTYSWTLASLYSVAGDFDNAFKYLDIALEERIGALLNIKYSLIFRPLHSDERYEKLLGKLGLVE